MSDYKRGEIYYIDIPYATGHEMEKDRPGIIVSCDELNRTSPVVAVVMCSASCKHELPEHITIRSTPVQSTALCEHIYTVDKSRISRRVGRCTKAEMAAVDIGLMAGLGLGQYDLARPCIGPGEQAQGCDSTEEKDGVREELGRTMLSLIRAETERDTYKALYEGLLDRMTMERRASA